MIGAFWLSLVGYFAILAFFIWDNLRNVVLFQKTGALFLFLLANGIVGVLLVVPGRLLAMWPYAVEVEPQNGIWLYRPATKLWIPLEELIDIDIYSGWYGGGHVVQLSRSHGLMKQFYINSVVFPDERLVHELRRSIDRRDGVVPAN
jgi:hypothetical protein